MDKRTQQELVPFILAIIAIVILSALSLFSSFFIHRKGIIGIMFISDAIAGTLALWAAYISTRQNQLVRIILMGAIFFFVFGRIAQFILI
jgi:hypothetical protein